jgi:hypothetical protein
MAYYSSTALVNSNDNHSDFIILPENISHVLMWYMQIEDLIVAPQQTDFMKLYIQVLWQINELQWAESF